MRNTLVIYSSVDGHTQKISRKIAEHIKHHENVDLTSLVDAQSLSLKNYQQVIIGASIRYGNYRKELFEFIEKNLDELSSKENAFFSVNVVARKPEKNTPDTNPYVATYGLVSGVFFSGFLATTFTLKKAFSLLESSSRFFSINSKSSFR